MEGAEIPVLKRQLTRSERGAMDDWMGLVAAAGGPGLTVGRLLQAAFPGPLLGQSQLCTMPAPGPPSCPLSGEACLRDSQAKCRQVACEAVSEPGLTPHPPSRQQQCAAPHL